MCTGGVCAPPTCSDGVQNQGETGLDCGGPCAPCLLPCSTRPGNVVRWDLPNQPGWMALGAGSQVWLTEEWAGRLARLDPASNVLTEWASPSPYAFGVGIDAAGSVWFAGWPQTLYSLDPVTSTMTSWNVAANLPFIVDAGGVVAFGEYSGNSIDTLNPATGTLTRWAIPTPGSSPEGLDLAPDGSLWFGEDTGLKIGRLDPLTGTISEWAVPSPTGLRFSVHAQSSTAIWFTETGSDKVARLDMTSNQITEWTVPAAGSEPFGLTEDAAGLIWFGLDNAYNLGRLDASAGGGVVTVVLPTTHTVVPSVGVAGAASAVVAPTTTTLSPVAGSAGPSFAGGIKTWSTGARTSSVAVDVDQTIWANSYFDSAIVHLDANGCR